MPAHSYTSYALGFDAHTHAHTHIITFQCRSWRGKGVDMYVTIINTRLAMTAPHDLQWMWEVRPTQHSTNLLSNWPNWHSPALPRPPLPSLAMLFALKLKSFCCALLDSAMIYMLNNFVPSLGAKLFQTRCIKAKYDYESSGTFGVLFAACKYMHCLSGFPFPFYIFPLPFPFAFKLTHASLASQQLIKSRITSWNLNATDIEYR